MAYCGAINPIQVRLSHAVYYNVLIYARMCVRNTATQTDRLKGTENMHRLRYEATIDEQREIVKEKVKVT